MIKCCFLYDLSIHLSIHLSVKDVFVIRAFLVSFALSKSCLGVILPLWDFTLGCFLLSKQPSCAAGSVHQPKMVLHAISDCAEALSSREKLLTYFYLSLNFRLLFLKLTLLSQYILRHSWTHEYTLMQTHISMSEWVSQRKWEVVRPFLRSLLNIRTVHT